MAAHAKDAGQLHFLIGHLSSGLASPAVPSGEFLWLAASKWFNKQIDRVKKDSRYAKALQAIRDRIKGPLLGPDDLPSEFPATLASASDFLTFMACAAVIPNRANRKAYQGAGTEGTDKTWKAIREFPKRIERMAVEIERLNRGTLLAPEQQINPKAPDAEVARQNFRELPANMRLCATALEGRIGIVSRLTADVFPRTPPHDYLARAVWSWTGKAHDKLVAELLNAVGIALGGKSDFDALTLAQARSRRKKKERT